MLTPKVEKDFKSWLKEKAADVSNKAYAFYLWSTFKEMPIEAQFGIYRDYFHSKHNLWFSIFPVMDMWVFQVDSKNHGQREMTLIYDDGHESFKTAFDMGIESLRRAIEIRL